MQPVQIGCALLLLGVVTVVILHCLWRLHAFVIQVDGEPRPQRSMATADLHLLAGGSNLSPKAFFCPLLIQEKGWTFSHRGKPMSQRSIDVLYRSSNCVPEREALVSTLRKCVEDAGFNFVATGKCVAGGHRTELAGASRDWGECKECQDAKMIVSFENYTDGLAYLSEKPFLPLEFGAVPLYHGNGQSLMHACGVNAARLIDASTFPDYSLFCQHVVDMLMSPWRLQELADKDYGDLCFDKLWDSVEQFTSTLPRVQALARKQKIRVLDAAQPPKLHSWLPRVLHIDSSCIEYVSKGPYDVIVVGCCWNK